MESIESSLQREERVFHAALEVVDPAARAAYLDRECNGDDELRAAVEDSLAAHADAEQFFTQTSAAFVPPRAGFNLTSAIQNLEAEAPGTCIGPYKLLQRLGEGGCGVVHMAEQEKPVRRRVAIKIIKLGMDTKSVLARFHAEQQALAMMDHPNISRVLDAGVTDSGRPYFVMELVEGVKLTTYCDENRLGLRQRLSLFVQVCHAIQHAHQKGIIHRDIKPSNILVTLHDGVAVPKVIDFGIAKAIEGRLTDQTLFTPCELFIGTPAYMSPEQAEFSGLDVDTRSDIYSLGVLLYELLTGKTPFDQKELIESGIDAMRRTLREREPQAPSRKVASLQGEDLTLMALNRRAEPARLKTLLSRDLDWIVMKALEKDRRRRYETANGLAADVKRYLENEPVMASPPSRLYRLQKLVLRNRVTFVAGGIVVVALAVFSAVSTWLLFKEREARQQAQVAEEQKLTLQQEVERNNRLRQVAEDQQKLLEALTLFGQGQHEQADVLLDKITLPQPKLEHAAMYREIGDWHAMNGRLEKAVERFSVLVEINHKTTGDTTMDDLRYAPLLVELGRDAEYERYCESLIARYAGTDNPFIAERVVKACLMKPRSVELMRIVGRFYEVSEASLNQNSPDANLNMSAWGAYSLSLMTYRRGDYAQTIVWCQRSRDYDRGMLTRAMSVQTVLAMAHFRQGDVDAARAELAEPRLVIEDTFKQGIANLPRWEGFWFDWIIARINLREAEKLMQ
jgi:serine/threonine protein kinase